VEQLLWPSPLGQIPLDAKHVGPSERKKDLMEKAAEKHMDIVDNFGLEVKRL
jgi:hypothetical protein